MRHAKVPRSSRLVPYNIRTSSLQSDQHRRIIDSLFLLAKALLRYVSRLFEVSGSTLAYPPRFRPPRVGTDVSRRYLGESHSVECIIFDCAIEK